MIKRVVGLYFSSQGRTASITRFIAQEITERINQECVERASWKCIDINNEDANNLNFNDETVVIIGMPVYVGKIPLQGLKAIKRLCGNGTMAIVLVSYGTKLYGNALYELHHFSEEQGFKVIGACAFPTKGKSVISRKYIEELDSVTAFVDAASNKLKRLSGCTIEGLRIRPAPLHIDGNLPVHKISRVFPKAAEAAQSLFEKMSDADRETEWFL
ncbi:MAG: hypothetical protein GX083_05285 [Clostridiales bacterium]|nr:hypothetical protein [Clostridiales bacterium]